MIQGWKRHGRFLAAVVLAGSLCATMAASRAAEFDPFGTGTKETKLPSLKPAAKGPIIPQVQFNNNDIAMVFQIISDATGWSIFPTAEVSKERINLWAKNITPEELLDKVVTMAGFVYHQENSIITVMTYDEYLQYFGLAKKVITPAYAEADAVAAVIRPFLTKLGKCVVHKETNSIVLYEADANLRPVEQIIRTLDCPASDLVIEAIDVQYADAEVLAKSLQEVFSDKKTSKENAGLVQGSLPGEPAAKAGDKGQPVNSNRSEVSREAKNSFPATIDLYAIGRTNQVLVKARKSDLEKVKALIRKLDVYMEPTTQNYQLQYVDAIDVFKGLDQVLNLANQFQGQGTQHDRTPRGLTLLENTNSIILTAPPSIHRIMSSIVKAADIPAPFETGVIRIYKLENADVSEVADVVRDLIGAKEGNAKPIKGLNIEPPKYASAVADHGQAKAAPPVPTAGATGTGGKLSGGMGMEQNDPFQNKIEAKVSVSKSTNSIIVQAAAREQRELEKVIRELDQRRRQVLIRAMIVEVTTKDNLNVGVELGNAKGYHLEFSSFGLSQIDPKTGQRTLIISPGGTAAYLDTEDMSAIIQALKSDGNAKVSSAPQVLVNDNAIGTIQNIDEEPTTQVNASTTVATTSFAGYVQAGTQFAIIPHISENDYLRVEYEITLNTFGARSADPSIPPPRSTSTIKSEATVPDSHTIIVGGLQAVDESTSFDKVPLVGDIPILGLAFRKQIVVKRYITSYLFITPCIMKGKDFADLKKASQERLQDVRDAEDKSKTPCQKKEEQIPGPLMPSRNPMNDE